MTLYIDPAGGIAGDMFLAALVSAGADPVLIKKAIMAAGGKLGTIEADMTRAPDGSTQLKMILKSHSHHLSGPEARSHLESLYREFGVKETYAQFGMRILQVLLDAEAKAHHDFHIILDDHQGQESRGGHNHHQGITLLHEAQDIVIDILGAVVGLQSLDVTPRATLLNPVSVGAGSIRFSHGTFDIPAPATRIILEAHRIPWQKGPIKKELCTPTGAAILAALESRRDPAVKAGTALKPSASGNSRGSHIYDIPPLTVILA